MEASSPSLPISPHLSPSPPTSPAPCPSAPCSLTRDFQTELNIRLENKDELELRISQIEQRRNIEFENFLGIDPQATDRQIGTATIQQTLAGIQQKTGQMSALVYVVVRPEQLDLILVSPEGSPILHSVVGGAGFQETVMQVARELREEVTNPRKRITTSYLTSAQQLYQWMVAPLEEDLEKMGISTLLFSMDLGLRTLPIAALHDGQQFLIEKYGVSLIPSFTLTDTRYQTMRNGEVLAMGASEFSDSPPLPAVPVEVEAIVSLWQGKSFLNEAFTLENLKAQRQAGGYQTIHLATHAEFQPGSARHSYIQLWDDKLFLDEMRNLSWQEPAVELLVLSACRTAVGDRDAELGFAGLAVKAGVKSALASLWYVSDEGTLGIMTQFYRHLQQTSTKAEALRLAQLDAIRGNTRIEDGKLIGSGQALPLPPPVPQVGKQPLQHPYYWAGFTMVGSPW